ncbi:hypothetical protein KSP40_PGU020904 [Platanthera guangdongensis]|uniref:Uncharacterized protein n=1 Tax=Platanthera guangdongensis TaxID=2320717 RepID=A0ABR2M2P5_9ASPA
MEQSFSTEIQDGSIEEIAEKLMAIHEDLVQGNYTSIENLRTSSPVTNALSLSRQANEFTVWRFQLHAGELCPN